MNVPAPANKWTHLTSFKHCGCARDMVYACRYLHKDVQGTTVLPQKKILWLCPLVLWKPSWEGTALLRIIQLYKVWFAWLNVPLDQYFPLCRTYTPEDAEPELVALWRILTTPAVDCLASMHRQTLTVWPQVQHKETKKKLLFSDH